MPSLQPISKIYCASMHLLGRSFIKGHSMLDVLVLVLGAVFFIATMAYAYACERL